MKIVEEFPNPIEEHADWRISLSDGCELSARIWMPANADEVPVPAIIEYLPYRKRDGTVARDELMHPWFAGHGYACLRVDIRGNGESQGIMDDEYTEQELQDACEVIRWAASQSWCSGHVGMMGISWGGFNSLQVAAMRPPGLKAIVTVCSSVDRFADDIHFKGGCLLTENVGWAANMLSYSSRPPDRAIVGERWREIWLQRLDNLPFLATTWLVHQARDEYWKRGSVCEDYSAIQAAVLAIGGWHDGYRNTVSHLLNNLQAPVKGITGPWNHKYPHQAAPKPAIGFLQETKRWWDHWLKGIDTNIDALPAYRAWLMDSIAPDRQLAERPGRWIKEQSWPSSALSMGRWQFTADTHGNAQLSTTPAEQPLSLTVNSSQHCGHCSGEYFPFNFGPELPDEQSADDSLSTVLDSRALPEAIDIFGAPVVKLRLSSSATTGIICIRLCEVRDDGSSALITSGFLNLTHHTSHENPQHLQPGEEFNATVSLDQIAFRIPARHRLRIAISTAYWPFVWPSAQSSVLTVSQGELQLPMRASNTEKDEAQFDAPECAVPWRADTLRSANSSRDVIVDVETGVVTTEIINDFGEYRDAQHGLVSGSITQERWSIHPDDPLSATAHITWQQNGGRDDWEWSTDVDVNMHCDAYYFYLSATVVAFDGESLVFARDYDERVARQFV